MDQPFTNLTPDELHEHGRWLRRLARRLAGDEAGADDLAQDAWLVFARSGQRARDVRSFLGGVVRNLAYKRSSREHGRALRERRAARDEALPSADELSEGLELSRVLAEELGALDEPRRSVVLLRYHEGLSAAEIARQRGVPAATVRGQLKRGLDELRERLDRRHAGERRAWSVIALGFRHEDSALATTVGAVSAVSGGILMTTWAKAGLVAGIVGVALLGLWAATRPAELGGASARTGAVGDALVDAAGTQSELVGRAAPQDARSAAPAETMGRDSAPGTVGLVVIDRLSGDPLPYFGVRLIEVLDDDSDGRELDVFTDAAGHATLSGAWFDGPFKTYPFDHEELANNDVASHTWTPEDRPQDGAPLRVEVRVGPTYRLRFVDPLPPGAQLSATLSGGEEVRADLWWSLTPVRGAQDDDWVRFDPSVGSVRLGNGPWRLVVRDASGFFLAWGSPTQISGVQADEVVLHGIATGTIDLTARVGGASPKTRMSIGLYRVPDDAQPEARSRHESLYPAGTDWLSYGSGRDRTKHLEPGTWRVSVGSDIHDFQQRVVEVLAGQVTPVEFDFEPRADLGSVRVVVTSETGRLLLGSLSVVASREGRDDAVLGRWVEGSLTSTTHVCEGLEEGAWTVRLERVEHLPATWSPGLEQEVRPDGREIVFTCEDADAPPAHAGGLVVRDARTGEPLHEAGVTDYVNSARKRSQRTNQDGRASIGPFLEGHEVQLVVRAAGYRAARLQGLAMPFEETLTVELEPGWGAVFEVVGTGGIPLEDIAVLVDGDEVGRTDAQGRLLVNRARRPERVEFQHADWVLSPGYEIDAEQGSLGANESYPIWVVLHKPR